MMSIHQKTIIVTIGVMLGIVFDEITLLGSLIAIFCFSSAFLLGLIFWKGKRETRSLPFTIFSILLLLSIFVGIVRGQFSDDRKNFICESSCSFVGVVDASPQIKNDKQLFPITVPGVHTEGVLVTAPLYPRYKIGDTLTISGVVHHIGVSYTHNGNKSFDYGSYLRVKNIGSVTYFPRIIKTSESSFDIKYILGRWREDQVTRLQIFVKEPSGTLASGMLFGTDSLSDEVKNIFKVAGLSHIIVLSGFNIAIIISFFFFILKIFPFFVRIVFTGIGVTLFVIMVGAEASIVRATLMSAVSLFALSVGRGYVARQALLISFLIIILYEPYSLMHDISLHLSFLATTGIIYCSEMIEIFLNKKIKIHFFTNVSEQLSTTVAAYVATVPYLMFTFGTTSVYALIANCLVLPLVPIAMTMSFIVILFSYISKVSASVFGIVTSIIIDLILYIGRYISNLPFSIVTASSSLCEMFSIYFVLIILCVYFLYKNESETSVTKQGEILTDIISY